MDVVQEAVGIVAEAAHSQSVNQRREKDSDRIVPVEKARNGNLSRLYRYWPRTPSRIEGGEHHRQRKAKTLRCEHVAPLGGFGF